MNRRGGQIYYAVAASRLYAEPKRLETLGYVTSEKRPGKTRERTFYTLTARGRDAPRVDPRAALPPPHPERGRPEAHVRRHPRGRPPAPPSSRCGARSMSRSSGSPRATRSLESLPHRRPYLLLVLDLGERLLAAQRAWLDEVERTLGRG